MLNTTVNHMLEAFEYQLRLDVMGDTEDGRYCYMLTGSTCLTSDIFEEYTFNTLLAVASKIIFSGVGAYTL